MCFVGLQDVACGSSVSLAASTASLEVGTLRILRRETLSAEAQVADHMAKSMRRDSKPEVMFRIDEVIG